MPADTRFRLQSLKVITITREGNVAELFIQCSGRKGFKRCERATTLEVSIWNYYGKESDQILTMFRQLFWITGWKEQPKGKGFLCPTCRGSHDPHRTGFFPKYLKTPK